MAIALVGSVGAASVGGVSAAVTPAYGQTPTAGNFLVLFVSVTSVATLPAAISGWSIAKQQAGTSCSASIYYKKAAGADAAPTVAAITNGYIVAHLAEFSGVATAGQLDQSGGAAATSSPVTATQAGIDSVAADLLIMVGADLRSTARATNDTWTSNRGTPTLARSNNGVSNLRHYSIGYILGCSANSNADTAVMTESITTSITGMCVASVSFEPKFNQTATPTGIASAEAHGMPVAALHDQYRTPTGIASAQAMGTVTLYRTNVAFMDYMAWTERTPAGAGSKPWKRCGVSDNGLVVTAIQNDALTVGTLWLSTNGGVDWTEKQPAGAGIHNWQRFIADADGSVLFACEYSGRCWLSTNGGSSWAEAQPAGAANQVWQAAAISDDGSKILVGMNFGRLYLTTNTGSSWAEVGTTPFANKYYYAAAMDADGSVLLAGGTAGLPVISTDGGTSWANVTQSLSQAMNEVALDDDGSHILWGENGGYLRLSTDGSTSYTNQFPAGDGLNSYWCGVDLNGTGTVIIAASRLPGSDYLSWGRVWVSFNGGTSWADQKLIRDGSELWASAAVDGSGYNFVAASRLSVTPREGLLFTGVRLNMVIPTGIVSAEAMGTPTTSQAAGNQTRTLTGLASAETHGSITVVKGGVSRSLTGIASVEAHGAVSRTATISRALTGIASGQAMGAPACLTTIRRITTGIASAEAHGTPTRIAGGVSRAPAGVASAAAHGSASRLAGAVTRTPGGVASAEAHGVITILKGDVSRSTTGIASAQAMGAATAKATITRAPPGIASAEAHGAPSRRTSITRSLTGIPSGEAHGAAVASRAGALGQTRTPTGIATAQACGTPTRTVGAVTRTPVGIPSGFACGTPTRLPGPVVRSPAGIGSGAAIGNPTAHPRHTIVAAGIASGEAMGGPTRLPGPVTCNLTGIASGEAHGTVVCSLFVEPERSLHCTARIVLRIHVAIVRRVWVSMASRGPYLQASTHRARAPRP